MDVSNYKFSDQEIKLLNKYRDNQDDARLKAEGVGGTNDVFHPAQTGEPAFRKMRRRVPDDDCDHSRDGDCRAQQLEQQFELAGEGLFEHHSYKQKGKHV